jgi:hypothetical protein
MHDSQWDKNTLEDRLKTRQTNPDQQSFHQRAKTLIRAQAREEFDHVMRLLNEGVQQRNVDAGDSPKFLVKVHLLSWAI